MQEMFGDSYYEADDVDPEFGSGEEMDLEKADSGKEDNFLELPKGWSWTTGQSKDDQSTATDGEATKGRISLKDKVELGKEMKEYYKLDHEDTIGDLKTRFKYKKVNPNSFGLSACEILASDDKDLNQYVPMKKLAPYRESEWKVTCHKKFSKDLILGVQKQEGKEDKSSKKPGSVEGPSSSEPDNDKPMDEQEETDAKRKSTRSGRRKRRNGDLKMSTKRKKGVRNNKSRNVPRAIELCIESLVYIIKGIFASSFMHLSLGGLKSWSSLISSGLGTASWCHPTLNICL
ncbi:hypothetical protein SEVIR_3G040650v4 [Setaria viridis]|uniref:Kri1-like C-terminal domain-containing protein n=1 Tax=Setaria viridis TaxID=4556 RepID=A0A4U6V761_SETVI|nr:hypothetical protein SEVIR_3G040650v2 [Setaria viridis]